MNVNELFIIIFYIETDAKFEKKEEKTYVLICISV